MSGSNINIKGFRIFECDSATDIPPVDRRKYSSTFSASTLRYLYFDIEMSKVRKPIDTEIVYSIYDEQGIPIVSEFVVPISFVRGNDRCWTGWGYADANRWLPGAYSVVIRIGDSEPDKGYFTITGTSEEGVLASPVEKKEPLQHNSTNLSKDFIIRKVRFFNSYSTTDLPPLGQRVYKTAFSDSEARYIYFEMKFVPLKEAKNAEIIYSIYDGDIPLGEDIKATIALDVGADTCWIGYGYAEANSWISGDYTVKIKLGDSEWYEDSFEIIETESEVSAVKDHKPVASDHRTERVVVTVNNEASDKKVFTTNDIAANLSGGVLVIPEGYEAIADQIAVRRNDIVKVIIPDSVKEIGEGAFTGSDNLEHVDLPQELNEIAYGVFSYCKNLRSVRMPSRMSAIGTSAFECCANLENLLLPNGLVTIGNKAFCGCESIETIILPKTLRNISEGAFWGCKKLKGIEIPQGITVIEKNAFTICLKLERVVLPPSVKRIKEQAFKTCESLTEIDLSYVSYIGDQAFAICPSLPKPKLLEYVTLGKDVFISESELMSGGTKTVDDGLYRRAENGDVEAMLEIAMTEEDADLGMYWLEQAIDRDYEDAKYYLYDIAQELIEADKYDAAKVWLEYLGHKDFAPAQASLGAHYIDIEDYEQSLNWYKRAAKNGDARAKAAVGMHYELGTGCSQDYKQAIYWYEQAINDGYDEGTVHEDLKRCKRKVDKPNNSGSMTYGEALREVLDDCDVLDEKQKKRFLSYMRLYRNCACPVCVEISEVAGVEAKHLQGFFSGIGLAMLGGALGTNLEADGRVYACLACGHVFTS